MGAATSDKFMKVKDVAAALGVVAATIYLWIDKKKIRAKELPSMTGQKTRRNFRIATSEVDRVRGLMDQGLWV